MKLYYGWVIVICSLIIFVALGTLVGTFGIFLEPLVAEFGWERGALSAAFSISTFLGGLFAIITGKLTDKYGPRFLVTTTGILTGIILFLMPQVNSLWQVYLLWGVLGAVAMGCCVIPISSTIPKWFTAKRGLAVSLGIVGMALGGAVWPILSQWLIDSYQWQQAFKIMGIIALIGIIIPAQFLKRNPQQALAELPDKKDKEKQVITAEGLSLNQAVKTSKFWIFGAILLLHNFYIMMVLVHMVPYAIDIGISSTTAAGALSIFVAISMFAQLIAGFMVDKVRGIRVLLFSITAAMISLFVLPFTVNTSMLFLFAVLLGITGAMNTLQTIVTVELFGTKYLGTVLGIVLFFGTVGGALGPIFGGSIFDNTGSYNPAFITCSGIGIVVFSLSLLLARVVRTNKKA